MSFNTRSKKPVGKFKKQPLSIITECIHDVSKLKGDAESDLIATFPVHLNFICFSSVRQIFPAIKTMFYYEK